MNPLIFKKFYAIDKIYQLGTFQGKMKIKELLSTLLGEKER